jgi:hypothetical protein
MPQITPPPVSAPTSPSRRLSHQRPCLLHPAPPHRRAPCPPTPSASPTDAPVPCKITEKIIKWPRKSQNHWENTKWLSTMVKSKECLNVSPTDAPAFFAPVPCKITEKIIKYMRKSQNHWGKYKMTEHCGKIQRMTEQNLKNYWRKSQNNWEKSQNDLTLSNDWTL